MVTLLPVYFKCRERERRSLESVRRIGVDHGGLSERLEEVLHDLRGGSGGVQHVVEPSVLLQFVILVVDLLDVRVI